MMEVAHTSTGLLARIRAGISAYKTDETRQNFRDRSQTVLQNRDWFWKNFVQGDVAPRLEQHTAHVNDIKNIHQLQIEEARRNKRQADRQAQAQKTELNYRRAQYKGQMRASRQIVQQNNFAAKAQENQSYRHEMSGYSYLQPGKRIAAFGKHLLSKSKLWLAGTFIPTIFKSLVVKYRTFNQMRTDTQTTNATAKAVKNEAKHHLKNMQDERESALATKLHLQRSASREYATEIGRHLGQTVLAITLNNKARLSGFSAAAKAVTKRAARVDYSSQLEPELDKTLQPPRPSVVASRRTFREPK